MLRPNANGWQKRIAFSFSVKKPKKNEDMRDHISMGLWGGLHDYMFKFAYPSPVYIHYDGYALSMWRAVSSAIDDWLDEHEAETNRYLVIKIKFAYSDLLRFANVCFRQCRFLEDLAVGMEFDKARKTIAVPEFAVAWHNWSRQLSLHGGYYAFMQGKCSTVQDAQASRAAGKDAMLAAELEKADPCVETQMAFKDNLKHQILKLPGLAVGQDMTTAKIKDLVKGRNRKATDLAGEVKTAVAELAEIGLLSAVDTPQKKGHHTAVYGKRAFSNLSQEADAERKRLKVGRGAFE